MNNLHDNLNKTKWKMMLDIEKILLNSNGSIFGGYVRDKIIHDHHADHFYEYISEKKYSKTEILQKYNDKTFLPEHNDRQMIPNDIDCYMLSSDLKKFLDIIRKKRYNIDIKSNQPAKFYFTHSDPSGKKILDSLMHTKIRVKFCVHILLKDLIDLSKYHVDLDIIHTDDKNASNQFDLLIRNFDFECNSLILTPNNEYKLPSQIGSDLKPLEKIKRLTQIIQDIKNKKAILLSYRTIPAYRFVKMLKKGWIVNSLHFNMIKNSAYDGHCIICHDKIIKNNYHIKDKHCDARFHAHCYLDMVNHDNFKNKCPMCNSLSYINKQEQYAIVSITKDLE